MKHCISFILSIMVFAGAAMGRDGISKLLPQVEYMESCDTVISVKDFPVRIIKKDGDMKRIGLDLFTDEIKSSFDRELLESLETTLAYKALGIEGDNVADIELIAGTLADFKGITPQTVCSISNENAKSMSVEWIDGNKKTAVRMSVSYQTVRGASRAEIERNFIDAVKNDRGNRKPVANFSLTDVEPYGGTFYVIPGGIYNSKNINRNVYLESDTILTPVWDSDHPLESMANLFILADGKYGNNAVKMTVMKHEIGDRETVNISVNQLLAYCERDGCTPFWGMEKYEDGKLEGALFLFNSSQGYVHVFRIICNPKDVIAGKGDIKIRASLYVPTNNVDDLFAPYMEKTDKERIRYDK